MTMFKPVIVLSRLVVTKGGVRVFDEYFHSGLNVIRGENGSGKTTIADFIFFALGGDTPQWRAEAALCDYVYAEVLINGDPLTFRREIVAEKFRPMAIYWGDAERAQRAETEWQLYPYSGTSGKESFSQAVFRVAGVPEVKGILSARVTLHQVLRLVYVDQKTDYDQLFRADPFDSHVTREAVGDLLCGVYDDRLYEATLQVAEKQAESTALQSELRAIHLFLGDQMIPSLAWFEEEKATYERNRERAYADLSDMRTQTVRAPVEAVTSRRAQLAAELAAQNRVVRDIQDRIAQAEVETMDRQQFLAALQDRLRALAESQAIHESLGAFSFQFCPACYAPLTPQDDACHLCKTKTEARRGQNLLHLRHELEQQIRESEAMQEKLAAELARLSQELRPAQDRQSRMQLQYDELSTAPYAAADAAAADIHRQIGYLDRTIEDLEQRSRFAARISAITDRQAALAGDISRLTDEIAARKAAQEQTKHDISERIARLTVDLLKRDIPREAAFAEATRIHFDFGSNRVSVDGRTTFAASSNVYLKNAFHLALFLASTLNDYMRYPRLAIFDNVEDKGMEPPRSHNFQRIVRELSAATEVEHQIILFTSMIAPEFENEPALLVGPYYTHEFKTLRFSPTVASAP